MNKPYVTKPVFIIEILSHVILIINLIYAAICIKNANGEIPIHFGFNGEVEGYGSPLVLLLMPIIMLVTNVITSAMLHFMPTSSWNLPFKVKQGKEVKVLICMAYMLALMEIEFALYSLIITIAWYNLKLSVIMPVTFAMLFACTLSIAVSTLMAYKINKA